MRFWRRAEKADKEPEQASRQYWERPVNPAEAILGVPVGIGDSPLEFQPKGPATVYEDEIEPEWRDPETDRSH